MTFGQPITAGKVEKQTLAPTLTRSLSRGRGTAKRHSTDQYRPASGAHRALQTGSDRLVLQRRIYRSSARRRGCNRCRPGWVGVP